jgi:16S rRNA (uracil1498-N3)-methyltransferase
MNRFFVLPECIKQSKVVLSGGQAYQISHVLRLKTKDRIIVLDNTGWEYEVEIVKVGGEVVGSIVNKVLCRGEPAIKITLYQAMLKADKFELILQKGVELGASAFVPYLSERCVTKKPLEGKLLRWQKIIQEAAEQSGRGLLPVLHPVVSFRQACEMVERPAVLFWEEEKSTSLRQVLRSVKFQKKQNLSIFIGPEGGFPSYEVQYATSKGIAIASLGARVLRAETAALAVISAVLYENKELG